MIKALIFDMDGVLLDSETLYKKSNTKLFESLGFKITDDQYQSLIGLSSSKIWETLISYANLPNSVEEYKQMEKDSKYQALLEENLTAHAHLFDVLHHCKTQNIKMAIASMSSMKNIHLIIKKLGIVSFFDAILSGENVVNGKPDPEIYIKAAYQLGVNPLECLAVEDSHNGSKAAVAANIACIGYINPGSGKQDLSHCFMTTDDYREILTHILNIKIND
ncbi:MAG: hypothetical protein RLZZ546_436 [Bacteroidota bacterium]|jgi:HAD superfamily hydrolase (TIGR01509 family)